MTAATKKDKDVETKTPESPADTAIGVIVGYFLPVDPGNRNQERAAMVSKIYTDSRGPRVDLVYFTNSDDPAHVDGAQRALNVPYDDSEAGTSNSWHWIE